MIRTDDDIAREIAALLAIEPTLGPIVEGALPIPLRPGEPGLPGLVATVVAQQVSRASAAAILGRLAASVDLADPAALLAAPDATLRLAGLSAAKTATLRALSQAALDGRLDFARIAAAELAAAVAELTAIKGIGLWTAECYLLFSLGHPDIFPAGDLALRIALAHGLGLDDPRPSEARVAGIAARFAPHRSIAARLFWRHYHVATRRDAAPAPPAT